MAWRARCSERSVSKDWAEGGKAGPGSTLILGGERLQCLADFSQTLCARVASSFGFSCPTATAGASWPRPSRDGEWCG